MSYNQISVTGIIANIPELKFAQSGIAYLALSIPDKKSKKNDQGGWDDLSATTWFRVTVFGEVAEMLAEKASKFDEVTATGRLISREFEKDGETRTSLEIDNARVAWHGPKQQRQQGGQQQSDFATGGGWGGGTGASGGGWTQGAQGSQGGGSNGYDEPPF